MVPGIVLSPFHVLTHLFFTSTPGVGTDTILNLQMRKVRHREVN